MKQISVVSYWDEQRGNGIFDCSIAYALHKAFNLWRQLAAKEGYALNTSDICPPQGADGIWLIDLPRKKRIFDRLINSIGKSTKVVLQTVESPLVTPYSHEPSNQAKCDFVLTYAKQRSSDPRRYYYRIPNYLNLEGKGIPFAERRCVIMINRNKMEGWFGSGGVNSNRFPGLGKFINGWDGPLAHLMNPARGELYSWRRKFARAAEEMPGRVLDIYGQGWNGDLVTWLPVARPKPYRCAMEGLLADPQAVADYHHKIPLIGNYRFGVAVENYRGTEGYISEKLFDVMRAGSVPIYLGEESIGEIVPPGAFVDARQFKNHKKLLHYLMNCPENEWQAMRAEGQSFLASKRAVSFSMPAFAETAMKILRKL